MRRKALAVWGFLILMAVMSSYGFVREAHFRYETLIEIGSSTVPRLNGVGRQLIESRKEFSSKLRRVHIPLARNSSEGSMLPNIVVSTDQGSNFFLLTSSADKSVAAVIADLHSRVVDLVEKDHNSVIALIKAEKEPQIQAERVKLDYLKGLGKSRVSDAVAKYERAKFSLKKIDQDYVVKLAGLDRIQSDAHSKLKSVNENYAATLREIKGLGAKRELIRKQIDIIQLRLANLEAAQGAGVDAVAVREGLAGFVMNAELGRLDGRLWTLRKEERDGLEKQRFGLDRQFLAIRESKEKIEARIGEIKLKKVAMLAEIDGAKLIATMEANRLSDAVARWQHAGSKDVAQQQAVLQVLETQLDQIVPTKVFFIAERRSTPEGISQRNLLVIMILLSTVLAVLGSFFWEGLSRRKVVRESAE